MRRILMIAYHFPPVLGSSGVQRTLNFSTYLLDHGWWPSVLTVHPRAYAQIAEEQLKDIPDNVQVSRAFALDTARHLSLRGSYPRFLAWPDRWMSWLLGAVPLGLFLILRRKPDIIWSTYPIATAQLIGYVLHRLTGLPWVADLRDAMVDDDYPSVPVLRRIFRWIERRTVRHASCVIFTTPGTRRLYAERYPEIEASRWICIRNGYDERTFDAASRRVLDNVAADGRVKLVHSGLLYRSERDPRPFFEAVAALRRKGHVGPGDLSIVLRASGNESAYEEMIEELGIADIVALEPAVPYVDALSEMLAADGLLIFQASNCNHQIPAKLYEYLRARKPILALTDPSGETAQLLQECDIDTIVRIDAKDEIETGLLTFLDGIRHRTAPVASDEVVARYSRQSQARELAGVLDRLAAG